MVLIFAAFMSPRKGSFHNLHTAHLHISRTEFATTEKSNSKPATIAKIKTITKILLPGSR